MLLSKLSSSVFSHYIFFLELLISYLIYLYLWINYNNWNNLFIKWTRHIGLIYVNNTRQVRNQCLPVGNFYTTPILLCTFVLSQNFKHLLLKQPKFKFKIRFSNRVEAKDESPFLLRHFISLFAALWLHKSGICLPILPWMRIRIVT